MKYHEIWEKVRKVLHIFSHDFLSDLSRLLVRNSRKNDANIGGYQSSSKHGRCTFLYSAMRELVCNEQLWARSALRQHRRFTRSDRLSIFQQQFGEYHGDDGCYSIYFDSSAIRITINYYKKSRMTILGLAGVLFCENEQA